MDELKEAERRRTPFQKRLILSMLLGMVVTTLMIGIGWSGAYGRPTWLGAYYYHRVDRVVLLDRGIRAYREQHGRYPRVLTDLYPFLSSWVAGQERAPPGWEYFMGTEPDTQEFAYELTGQGYQLTWYGLDNSPGGAEVFADVRLPGPLWFEDYPSLAEYLRHRSPRSYVIVAFLAGAWALWGEMLLLKAAPRGRREAINLALQAGMIVLIAIGVGVGAGVAMSVVRVLFP
ncbi:MAG: hypothetical protein ACYTGQ_02525 [Planctomycetota bacterium]|jgi:hypothetical protein